MKKRRMIAAVMCLALLLVMVFSAAYIVIEATHNCIGDGCPICHEIQICQQVLNTVGTALVRVAVSLGALFLLVAPVHTLFRAAKVVTLISLKVKLSD